MNRFAWNLRAEDAIGIEGMIMWAAGTTGTDDSTGDVHCAGDRGRQDRDPDLRGEARSPRTNATQAELDAQYTFLSGSGTRATEANNAVRTVRNVKAQLADRRARAGARGAPWTSLPGPSRASSPPRRKRLPGQEPSWTGSAQLSIRLNNQIAGLAGVVAAPRPNPPSNRTRCSSCCPDSSKVQLDRLQAAFGSSLAAVNAEPARLGLPPIVASPEPVKVPIS